jgi:hypothetical protein
MKAYWVGNVCLSACFNTKTTKNYDKNWHEYYAVGGYLKFLNSLQSGNIPLFPQY